MSSEQMTASDLIYDVKRIIKQINDRIDNIEKDSSELLISVVGPENGQKSDKEND